MLREAEILVSQGQYSQAIEAYDRVIHSQPDKISLLSCYNNQAFALSELGRHAEAAEAYSQLMKIDPDFQKGKPYGFMGREYQLAGNYKASRDAYQIYLKRYPKDYQFQFNLGYVLEELKDFESANKHYQNAYSTQPQFLKAYIFRIAALKKLRNFEQILLTCKKALKQDPTNYELLYEQGEAHFSLGHYKQALYSLRQSSCFNPTYAKAQEMQGVVLFKMEKYSDSETVFDKCLKQNHFRNNQQRRQVIYHMGVVKMTLEKYLDAVECFSKLSRSNPSAKQKLALCYECLGNASYKNRCFSDAIEHYRKSIQANKRKSSVYNNIGMAYNALRNKQMAQRYFDMGLEIEPQSPILTNNKAIMHYSEGDKEAALNLIEPTLSKQGSESNTTSFRLLVTKGKMKMEEGKYEQGLNYYYQAEKLAEKAETSYDMYNDMAVALETLQRYKEAAEYATKAVELSKAKSPLILTNRANILMKLGRVEEAKKDLDITNALMNQEDKDDLRQFGLDALQLQYIFRQMNHYSKMMKPLDIFRNQLAQQIKTNANLSHHENLPKIESKMEEAQKFAVERVVEKVEQSQVKRQVSTDDHDFEEQSKDMSEMNRMMDEMQRFKMEMVELKKKVTDLEDKLKYIPMSGHLKQRFDQLEQQGDIVLRAYGKQLYWVLSGYLKGYMLIATGIVAKGDSVDKSTLSDALGKTGKVLQFAQNIPIIGDIAQLMSNLCGLFVDIQTDTIVQKMYEMISFNYDTEEDLNDAICEAVLLCLDNPYKVAKVREQVVFKPSQGMLNKIVSVFDDVCSWFKQKKDNVVMSLRGKESTQNIIQQELATIDVGCVIAIMLNMNSELGHKQSVLQNAFKRLIVEDEVEKMVLRNYKVHNPTFEATLNCLAPSEELIGHINRLAQGGDIVIQSYGYQLYWVLASYFKGVSLVAGKNIPVGSEVDGKTLSQGLLKVKQIQGYAQHAQGIQTFGRLIARVCGIYLDKDEDEIASKLHSIVIKNYDSENELNIDISRAVSMCLSHERKITKVREHVVFDPAPSFFKNKTETFEEVRTWFGHKKEEFCDYMGKINSSRPFLQQQYAITDAGSIVAILLSMENLKKTQMNICRAVGKMLDEDQVESMIHFAYKRDNESLRVSQNTMCAVMRVEIVYDNPLLNDSAFLRHVGAKQKGGRYVSKILNFKWQTCQQGINEMLKRQIYEQLCLMLDTHSFK